MINFNSWFLLLLYFNSISSCTRLSSFKVHLSLPQFVRSLMSVLSKIKFRIKIKIEIFFRYWSFVRIIFLQLFSSPSKTIPSNFEPNLGSVRRWKIKIDFKVMVFKITKENSIILMERYSKDRTCLKVFAAFGTGFQCFNSFCFTIFQERWIQACSGCSWSLPQ